VIIYHISLSNLFIYYYQIRTALRRPNMTIVTKSAYITPKDANSYQINQADKSKRPKPSTAEDETRTWRPLQT